MMGSDLALFIALSLGYALCVLAKKQDGLLKTIGYTLGIAIIVLSLVGAVLMAQVKSSCMGMGKMGKSPCCMKMGGMKGKPCPMVKH